MLAFSAPPDASLQRDLNRDPGLADLEGLGATPGELMTAPHHVFPPTTLTTC